MTPALEYLIRTGLIREWLVIPCSLFLEGPGNLKKVVTIADEFRPSECYSVKHWNINQCDPQQVVPSMEEFRVRKDNLFGDPATLVPFYKPIPLRCLSIPSEMNEVRSPMPNSVYDFFFSNPTTVATESGGRRTDWLWTAFRKTYLNDFLDVIAYISAVFQPDSVRAAQEREWIFRHSERFRRIWQKWLDYMLHSPGELFFYKEYAST